MKKILIVARFTFYEAVKSKLLMNAVFLGTAILISTLIASSLTYGKPEKIALDIGLGLTSLSLKVIAIFYGVGIIQQEIESRSIYLVLSRPIGRAQYFIGRTIGMSLLLAVNTMILGVLSLVFFKVLGGSLDQLMLWTLLFMYMSSILLLLIVVITSLVVTKVIAILSAMSIYMAGHSASSLLESNNFAQAGVFNFVLEMVQFVLPDFSRLNLKDYILYEQSLPFDYLLKTLLASILYGLGLVSIGCYIIKKKNLD